MSEAPVTEEAEADAVGAAEEGEASEAPGPAAGEVSEAPVATPPTGPRAALQVPARSPWWLVASLGVALAAGLFAWRRWGAEPAIPPAPPPPQLFDAVPTGATLLVTVDLRALRGTPLGQTWLGGDRQLEGAGSIRAACGFDPLAAVDELALVVPAAGDAEFGLVAVGTFDHDAVARCARTIIADRGGQPVSSPLGGFATVRDAASPSGGEIAVRPGLLLLGGGAFLRTLVDTAEGRLPTVRTEAAHPALRAGLGGEQVAMATLVLSPAQRATIADEITRTGGAAPSALGRVGSAAAGLRLSADRAHLLVLVQADDAAGAQAVRDLADGARRDLGRGLAATMLGTDALLARASLVVEGTRAVGRVDASFEELRAVGERAAGLRQLAEKGLLGGRPGPAPTPAPAPSGSSR